MGNKEQNMEIIGDKAKFLLCNSCKKSFKLYLNTNFLLSRYYNGKCEVCGKRRKTYETYFDLPEFFRELKNIA